ncbi:MAG: twin-arginine translocase TatA/TatE family subunit [Dehalococcoidia bacterium]|nr:twin-arginine translocase TatA/TatE family subunit [Dehalococcoidia bacterium]
MPFKLGPWEIGLIIVIILIVFGVGKLPQVGSALGKGLRSFRSASKGEDEESETTKAKETEAPKAKAAEAPNAEAAKKTESTK